MELCNPRINPGARKGELRLGRIDPVNLGRRAPFDQPCGKSAVAAADIDPPQARTWVQPVEKHIARQSAPGSHHALIGGAILEADLMFGHFPLLRVDHVGILRVAVVGEHAGNDGAEQIAPSDIFCWTDWRSLRRLRHGIVNQTRHLVCAGQHQ